MSWISFDHFRTLGMADTCVLKPDQMFSRRETICQADWVLFPEYWQLGALVYGFGRRIFPSLPSYLLGHNKIEMTRAFTAVAPENVPETHICANTPEQAERLWALLETPFVAKLPRSSQGQGVWLIEERADWKAYLGRTDILYVQEYLPIDRDLRVVFVGDRVIESYWRLQSSNGFHNNLSRGGEVFHGPVPESALQLVMGVAGTLGIDHAGFDIAMVGSRPYLIEFNRLFGNAGIRGGDGAVRDAITGYLLARSAPRNPGRPRSGRRPRKRAA